MDHLFGRDEFASQAEVDLDLGFGLAFGGVGVWGVEDGEEKEVDGVGLVGDAEERAIDPDAEGGADGFPVIEFEFEEIDEVFPVGVGGVASLELFEGHGAHVGDRAYHCDGLKAMAGHKIIGCKWRILKDS